MNSLQKNWKTTAIGVCGLLAAIGSLGSNVLSGDFSSLSTQLPAILASVGLLFASDASKH